MMEWISVKDKLPELRRVDADHCESDYVLVFAPDYYYTIFTASYEVYNFGSKTYDTFLDITRNEIPTREVTHWMQLPEQPKGD